MKINENNKKPCVFLGFLVCVLKTIKKPSVFLGFLGFLVFPRNLINQLINY